MRVQKQQVFVFPDLGVAQIVFEQSSSFVADSSNSQFFCPDTQAVRNQHVSRYEAKVSSQHEVLYRWQIRFKFSGNFFYTSPVRKSFLSKYDVSSHLQTDFISAYKTLVQRGHASFYVLREPKLKAHVGAYNVVSTITAQCVAQYACKVAARLDSSYRYRIRLKVKHEAVLQSPVKVKSAHIAPSPYTVPVLLEFSGRYSYEEAFKVQKSFKVVYHIVEIPVRQQIVISLVKL